MVPSPTSSYTYTPLLSNGTLAIRLINLSPALATSAELHCTILEVDLLDDTSWHPPYAALSYAWGSGDKTCSLHSDAGVLAITASLDAALRAVRKTTWPLLLWADAVCIDQANTGERNSQVANMVHVYSRAASVLIWTGGDDAAGSGARCLEWLQFSSRNYALVRSSEMSPEERALLQDFFGRAWFERRCVIQEAAVATHAFVYCGARRISWRAFIDGVAVLRLRHDATAAAWYNDILAKLCMIEELNKNVQVMGAKPGTRKGSSLLELLLHFEAALCTDAKDRVFSLMRLATEDEVVLQALGPSLDYSLPTESVYVGVATALLKQSDSYALLHFAAAFRGEGTTPPSSLPSWVPDWRYSCRVRPLLHPDFKCGLGGPGKVCVNRDGSLRVRGCILDYISSRAKATPKPQRGLREIVEASEALVTQDFTDAVGALRLHSADLQSRSAPVHCEDDRFLESFRHLVNLDRLLDDAVEAKGSPSEHQEQAQASAIKQSRGPANTIDTRVKHSLNDRILRGRRIFETTSGRLGIGPADTEAGDAIVMIYGTRTPFILRKNTAGTGWRIVGDSYVAGITRMTVQTTRSSRQDFVIT